MEAWTQANQAGRHQDALPLIAGLVAAYPQEPALHFRHAQTLRELGHYEEALQALDRLLGLRPQTVPALLQCAELQSLLGQPMAAEDALRRAVTVDPRHAEARIRLVRFLTEQGDFRQASYELDQVVALDPASPAAAELRQRLLLARELATTPVAVSGPAMATPTAARLWIDELPVSAPKPVVEPKPAEPPPELPSDALQALLDGHWARLRLDQDRLAATASLTALLMAWAPMPELEPMTGAATGPGADHLRALGYQVLARLKPRVRLPFAGAGVTHLWIDPTRRALLLHYRPMLPPVTILERCWLQLTGRWRRLEMLELCSGLVLEGEGQTFHAMIISNNLGGQMPFVDLPPVHVQRFSPGIHPKALDRLHSQRIDALGEELGGTCLSVSDVQVAGQLLREIHQQRRHGRLQQNLLNDEELQRFLGSHYSLVAGRVYRQLETLQQQVQDLLSHASRANDPA